MATTAPVSTIVARKTTPKLPLPMICSALNCHCFPSMTSPTFGAAALAAAPSAPSPRRPFLCGCCRASWSTADEETSRRRLDSACLRLEWVGFAAFCSLSRAGDMGVSRGRAPAASFFRTAEDSQTAQGQRARERSLFLLLLPVPTLPVSRVAGVGSAQIALLCWVGRVLTPNRCCWRQRAVRGPNLR